jgi:hypothetical protein
MKCNICDTENTIYSCKHRYIDGLKVGDFVDIKRQITISTQKSIISRKIRAINNDMVHCDDNIEYNISQVICKYKQ